MWGQISYESCEEADDTDRGDETGPSVPVLGGWDKGKQNLPEDSQEVHDVVVTRRKALLFVVIAIAWRKNDRYKDKFCFYEVCGCSEANRLTTVSSRHAENKTQTIKVIVEFR